MVGLFLLFGIVKKDDVLQVDYANLLRAKGLDRDDAILRVKEVRQRPILMTDRDPPVGRPVLSTQPWPGY